MDIGIAFTKALDANYGFLNMEFKYSFLKESKKLPPCGKSFNDNTSWCS